MDSSKIMNLEIITCNKNNIGINSYILKSNNHVVLIDPYDFKEIINMIKDANVDYIFLTHEHFDHILSVDKIRDKYNAKLVAHALTSKNIQSSTKNMSKYADIIINFMNTPSKPIIDEIAIREADLIYTDNYSLCWQSHKFFFKHTPGHSMGSSCIIVDSYLFTGDSLFASCATDIKGQGSSRESYDTITIPFFKSLDKNMKVFAGHYNSFILKDNQSIYPCHFDDS